jgi:hypothetical protein
MSSVIIQKNVCRLPMTETRVYPQKYCAFTGGLSQRNIDACIENAHGQKL